MEGGKNLFLYRKEHPVKNPHPGGSPCGGAEHTAVAARRRRSIRQSRILLYFLYRKEHPVKNSFREDRPAAERDMRPAPSGNVVPFMADIRIWDIIWFQADIYHYLTNQLTIIPGQWQMLQILTRGL